MAYEETARVRRDQYPTPWAVNVVPEDMTTRRLRGGCRAGLEKHYAAALAGTSVGICPIQPWNPSSSIAYIADGQAGVLSTSAVPLTDYLLTEAGHTITTEGGDPIVVSNTDATVTPASAFLFIADAKLWVVDSSGVVSVDLTTGAVDPLVASAGSVPTGCTFGCFYQGRLLLAGADNAIYASRMGDFTDWDFGVVAEDVGRAFVFQLSESTEIGGTTTALVPHKDRYLLAATQTGLWAIHGNPAGDGTMQCVHRQVGIWAARSWCKVQDTVVFLAKDGLWKVGVDGSGLEMLSRDNVPEEITYSQFENAEVILGYDHDTMGVNLFLPEADVDSATHWHFDLREKGFWPLRFASDCEPQAVCQAGDVLLMLGADGHIRSFLGATDDDGTDIPSHLLIGPLPLANAATEIGRLVRLQGTIGTGSDSVTWSLVTGDTAEEAASNAKAALALHLAGDTDGADAYVAATGTLSAGRSHIAHPHTRAPWAVIWLHSTGAWGYEAITIETQSAGRWR